MNYSLRQISFHVFAYTLGIGFNLSQEWFMLQRVGNELMNYVICDVNRYISTQIHILQ